MNSSQTAVSQLRVQVEQLQHGVTVSSLSTAARQEIQNMLAFSELALNQHRILKALAFDSMYGRIDAIPMAHEKTFKWIFAEPPKAKSKRLSDCGSDQELGRSEDGPDESSSRDSYRDSDRGSGRDFDEGTKEISDCSSGESFLSWLSSGNGIFHVSGKPGSGKSTLMKFLCDHPRTQEELQEWAGKFKLLSTLGNSYEKARLLP
jgi:Cdc6-like AAA superfamily ATPase